jgi:hypothetical protein
MTTFLAKGNSYKHFAHALLLLSALNVLAAIIDIGSSAVGVNVLSVIKTGGYTMHDGEEVGGMRRIVGTFTEASAFSGFTIPLFAFSANLWLFAYRPRLTGFLTFASGVLLILSTSATAYLGLVGYLTVLVFGRCSRIAPRSGLRKRRLFVVMICGGIMALLFCIVFKPGVLESVGDFFDATVMAKANSDSGVERGNLNRQALVNIVETYGFGVGIGSSKASSFALVLLSNLGIVGTIFFAVFVWKCTLTPISTNAPLFDRVVCYASRQAMLALLVTASVSGAMVDLGPCFYMFAAAAGMLSAASRGARVAGLVYAEQSPASSASGQASQPSKAACNLGAPSAPMLDAPRRESRIPAWPHQG